ncbi:MAG: DUF6159 family protein [Candidatus Thalassarchaeaceae archaeon]|jgi:hypothetical protein|nr:DUF6159 family protein [Candidatus Thalassarchaeaceae archaeon]MDP6703245.1 DUF6159 family protein [Candidatus Thalassarchaeaceae archaeon]MDP7004016.1 DUF6159 family protein [Candidatus Thalassarchaeaceae archaeon]
MMMSRAGHRVGFFERIGRGWKMTKLGMAVVRADPELMVYTLLSAVFSLVAIGAAISGSIGLEAITESDSAATGEEDGLVTAGHMAIWFVFYLVVSVITVFWNAAIIASAYERLTAGTNPSFSYGIGQAMKCLPQILVWGIIAGTVGLFLQILEGISKDSGAPAPLRLVAGIASFILGIAWWIVTFFIIPMIVLERAGVIEGMNESPRLFKKTWGEDIASHIGTGVLMSLVILLLFVIFLPLMMLGEVGAVIGGVSLVLGLFLTVLFFSTVEAVNRASLFYYAKTGQSPPMAQKHGLSF